MWSWGGKLLAFIITLLRCNLTWEQLVINVKNEGGDVLQETILANVSDDTVTLEFQRPDGTLITQFIDFKTDTQIFRAVVLGEEERGQSQYQVMCFVTRLPKNEFISSDAMSKLRQKNPGTIRQPEEDKGKDQMSMELLIDLEKSSVISHHIRNMCAEANDAIYARENDLHSWAKAFNYDVQMLSSVVKRLTSVTTERCKQVGESWKSCACRLQVCVGWYPCGLKYCKGKDSTGRNLSYRCGIKTCKKCRLFDYFVTHKNICLWDE